VNLILLHRGEVDEHGCARLNDHRAAHIRDVLRAVPGDVLRVGLLDGPAGRATVRRADANAVELACAFDADTPPRPPIDLLLALPRPKVLKRLWPQLAALGVGRILLTNAARVERNYFDTHVLDPAFYTTQLIEGLQQARDTRLPLVTIHRRFRPLVEDELSGLSDATLRLVADPAAAAQPPEATGGRVLLAVGPEGGWVPFELDLLRQHGFQPFGLGPRTLRSDTACIAALAVARSFRLQVSGSTSE
jgi:RsmE family RNA methyltransferase